MSQAAINVLTGILIAIVSAWVTVRLSLKRFRSEKWWERKMAAYERVIEALHHSKAFSDTHLEARLQGRDVSEERDQELRKYARDAHREIEKAADVGSFLLSPKALERLKQYQKDAKEAQQTEHWEEYLMNDSAALESCLEDFIKIAKSDLKAR